VTLANAQGRNFKWISSRVEQRSEEKQEKTVKGGGGRGVGVKNLHENTIAILIQQKKALANVDIVF